MKNGVCSSYNMKNGECFHLDVFIIVLSFCWVLHPYFRVAPETLLSGYLSQKNDRSEILLPCIDSLQGVLYNEHIIKTTALLSS